MRKTIVAAIVGLAMMVTTASARVSNLYSQNLDFIGQNASIFAGWCFNNTTLLHPTSVSLIRINRANDDALRVPISVQWVDRPDVAAAFGLQVATVGYQVVPLVTTPTGDYDWILTFSDPLIIVRNVPVNH